MPRYDLAGNPLPETDPPPSPHPALVPSSLPLPAYKPAAPAYKPAAPAPKQLVYAPAPATPPAAPPAPPAPHAILTRGIVQETPSQKLRAYAGLVGTFLLLIAITYAVAAIPPPHTHAPSSYMPYTSQNAAITCDAPGGWKREEDSDTLAFSSGKSSIEVDAPPADDVSASPTAADLYAQTQDMLADSFTGGHFEEQPAQPLKTGMSDAVISQWTAAPGLMHLCGYRATLISGSNAVVVLCVCPQRDWATLRPVFLHVIQSMTSTVNASAQTQNGGQQP